MNVADACSVSFPRAAYQAAMLRSTCARPTAIVLLVMSITPTLRINIDASLLAAIYLYSYARLESHLFMFRSINLFECVQYFSYFYKLLLAYFVL